MSFFKTKRIVCLLLSVAILASMCSFVGITAYAESMQPANLDNYFYFVMEQTDFLSEYEGSQYYGFEDEEEEFCFSEKYRIMDPVKVYENGFYDYECHFIPFSWIYSLMCEEGMISENDVKSSGNGDILIDDVATAVNLLLYYYTPNDYFGWRLAAQDEYNFECGGGGIDSYAMEDGCITKLYDFYGFDYYIDCEEIKLFKENELCEKQCMNEYKWSDESLAQSDVFRVVCNWYAKDYEDYGWSESYTSPAGDDLIRAVADYHELKALKTEGVEDAADAYVNALSNYFGEDADDSASVLKDALPERVAEDANAGEIVVKTSSSSPIVVGNQYANISAKITSNVGSLSYQWYRDGEKIDGATDSTYYLENETSGTHKYKVEVTATVSNDNKDIQMSEETELTFYDKPTASINNNKDVKLIIGMENIISAAASCDSVNYPGNTLTYQWQQSTNEGLSYSQISGATGSTLTLCPKEYKDFGEKYYRLRVTDSGMNSVYSEPVKVNVVPAYDENGWDGTFDDDDEPDLDFNTMTYQIGTPGELAWYANYVKETIDAENKKEYHNDFVPVYNAAITADIDLNNQKWTPIGKTTPKPSNFTFDGNGHKITGLYLYDEPGLFGYIGSSDNGSSVSSAKRTYVKNLTVEGFNYSTWGDTALLAGNAGGCTFENVVVKGKVINTYENSNSTYAVNIAGIVAEEDGCSFLNCINYADITYTGECANIGGITAYQVKTWGWGGSAWRDWDYTNFRVTTIKNCINLGTITEEKSSDKIKTDPIIAFINNKDNRYSDYRNMTGADANHSYTIYDAVDIQNNLYISGSCTQESVVNTYPAPKAFDTSDEIMVIQCSDGELTVDVLSNLLLSDDSKLEGKVLAYINNKDENCKSATVILALYDNCGKLLTTKLLPTDLEQGNNVVSFDEVSVNHKGDYKLKIMVWDNMKTLKPTAKNVALQEVTNN